MCILLDITEMSKLAGHVQGQPGTSWTILFDETQAGLHIAVPGLKESINFYENLEIPVHSEPLFSRISAGNIDISYELYRIIARFRLKST